ncbi:hypothetical protein PRZ48_012525 [Zasmidium cellare]|uniref:Uncharacterized protein n=1 Tax=Zasmidium cellare TaxID=395010 RepID=A0ABR0E5A2_ZASCE|nr:hypothetical protein PRZ48_012525 [Zasmidium cellare]
MRELGIVHNTTGREEFLIDPPTEMEVHVVVRVYDQDQESGDVGHIVARVQVMPCAVGALLPIAEAMVNSAVAQWPDEPGTWFLERENEEAVAVLVTAGQLEEGQSPDSTNPSTRPPRHCTPITRQERHLSLGELPVYTGSDEFWFEAKGADASYLDSYKSQPSTSTIPTEQAIFEEARKRPGFAARH